MAPMAPSDAPSPSPSHMPPPNLKRPRQSNPPTTVQPRPKRQRPEGSADQESIGGDRVKSGRGMTFGMGMVKGREEEWGEPGDVQSKIDFTKLPLDALYRYLEYHDLLPRWDVSPWSEEPCTPPFALYAIPPAPPTVPIVASPTAETRSPPLPGSPSSTPLDAEIPTDEPDPTSAPALKGDPLDPQPEEEHPAPPTTRSKTAPHRRAPTPPPPSPPQTEVKRGVITLSDVLAARQVLAEKANAHWVKGLGGGQNKEGETIVNFLYKMKVGHGRLLRVYNPAPAPYP